MGDRGNIVMEQETGEKIYFYTHWDGYKLPLVLQQALWRGQDRWDDEPYLGRIIFCEMIKDDVNGNTGYGISTYECDNEHDLLVVNVKEQTVTVGDKMYTFQEYIDLPIEIDD